MPEFQIQMKFDVNPQTESEKVQLVEAIHTFYRAIAALPGIGSCHYEKVDFPDYIPAPF